LPPSPDVTGELTLRDAMAAALIGNPELAGFGYEVRAAEARVIQAGLASNPELAFEVENFAGSGGFDGTDAAEYTLVMSQNFPLGGDTTRRKQAAQLTGRLAGWDYEAQRIALLTETTRRFVSLLSAQRRVALAEKSLGLAQDIADAFRRRVEAGNAPAIEQSRVAVPLAEARIELGRARRDLEAARVRLSLTWGDATPTFTSAVGDLDRLRQAPAAADLAKHISQNPDVARWVVEIASRQAEIELARAEAVPDLTGSLGYRWFDESDDGAFVAGLSIPLPIIDRGRGDILAARFGVASAQNKALAVRLRVEAALASSYSQLVNAYEESAALRDDAIPAATAAYNDIRLAFDRGDLGYLDVLDAERTLIDMQSRYLDAATAYHVAVAETEALIGQSLFLSETDTADPRGNDTTPHHKYQDEKQ
jgi:cobalt-zinc-cadmium efflux system outer membrane protein